ncbi:MAG: 5'-nucleotidase C-terminal domain-containing protein [Bacteroidales bacterium]
MKSLRFYFLAGVFFLAGFSFQTTAREIKIQIAVTSDVHARIFPYDFINDRPTQTSMASVHYLMESARTRYGENLILLDNGDMLQGTPAAYYANFVQDSKKNLFSRVMNLMKYDAATVGNHDIEAGPAVYNRLKEEFDFPYLGANVLDEASGKPHFQPYIVIKRQRMNIVVLGLTTPSVPNWLPPHLWEGLLFQDMAEAAAHWVSHIREHEAPDAIIGLFHSGYGSIDPPLSAHPLEQASAYIARTVPGFDVIFTGHDHRERIEHITNIEGGEVLVLGPGHFAENLAVAELVFERTESREYELTQSKGEVVSTRNVAPSQSFFREFEKDVAEIIEFSREPVGILGIDMHSLDVLFGPAPFSDLVHKVQLELTGADVSFTAPLAFDETIKAGTLLVRDFFRIYEYENYLYTMELSGQEVLDYLEFSYGLWLNEMQSEDDHLLSLRVNEQGEIPEGTQPRFRLRNAFYNFDSAAGIRYVVDVSRPVGDRVRILGMEDGRPFEADRIYRVAINSYRGSGGGGHLTRGAGIEHENLSDRIVFASNKDLRSMLMDYFQRHQEVTPEKRNNWEIIPAPWKEKGRQKDMELLRMAGD